jgi:hypothetical protein
MALPSASADRPDAEYLIEGVAESFAIAKRAAEAAQKP